MAWFRIACMEAFWSSFPFFPFFTRNNLPHPLRLSWNAKKNTTSTQVNCCGLQPRLWQLPVGDTHRINSPLGCSKLVYVDVRRLVFLVCFFRWGWSEPLEWTAQVPITAATRGAITGAMRGAITGAMRRSGRARTVRRSLMVETMVEQSSWPSCLFLLLGVGPWLPASSWEACWLLDHFGGNDVLEIGAVSRPLIYTFYSGIGHVFVVRRGYVEDTSNTADMLAYVGHTLAYVGHTLVVR